MLADVVALGLGATGFGLVVVCVLSLLSDESYDFAPPFACPLAAGALAAGAGTFVLAPPIIHFAHERVGPGLLSLALRALLPGAAIYLGVETEDSALTTVVFLSALATAVAIDWLVLTVPSRKPATHLSLAPTEGGASLLLLRTF